MEDSCFLVDLTWQYMNIGITCYPVYGGSGVVATELGKALARRGHEIHFISNQMPFRLGSATEDIHFHEVGVRSYPIFHYHPYSLALSSTMVEVARYHALDLLHVHYAIPHATSAILARDILRGHDIRMPVVTTLHGTDVTIVGQDPTFAPVVTHSINASDGVTAVSDALRQETYKAFDVHGGITVIPNFINVDEFSRRPNAAIRERFCSAGEKVLVHISNFRQVKNTPHVVHIFNNLRQRGLAVKLLLVGDGPDRASAERLARKLQVHAHVHFLGKRDPVAEILSMSDVFIMPSGSESFGLAALEAMACGVPVVCTDIGGLPELMAGSDAGFLCPLGDLAAFTERTAQLIQDDALRQRMSQAARLHAVSRFNEAAIVPRYEALYERVHARVVGPPSG